MAFLGGENASHERVPSRARSAAMRALSRATLLAAGLVLAACQNPCDALAERVCGDLDAADCRLWIADSRLSRGMLPLDDPAARRLSVAGPTCEQWLAEGTYQSQTLPTVKARIASARAGGATDPPSAPDGTSRDDVGTVPPLRPYALFPAALILVALVAWWGRKLRSAMPAPRGRLSTPPP